MQMLCKVALLNTYRTIEQSVKLWSTIAQLFLSGIFAVNNKARGRSYVFAVSVRELDLTFHASYWLYLLDCENILVDVLQQMTLLVHGVLISATESALMSIKVKFKVAYISNTI